MHGVLTPSQSAGVGGEPTKWSPSSTVKTKSVLLLLIPAALAPGGDGLDAYKSLVQTLADLCVHFGRPVLLINGDSHLYETDQPLADPSSVTGLIHGTQAVPNLTRITVQGSTNMPREWLRLTIDPRSPQIFSWENVVY